MDMFLDFCKKYKLTLILSLVALVVLIVCFGFVLGGQKKSLVTIQNETAQLQSQAKMLEQQMGVQDEDKETKSGLNEKRFKTDVDVLNKLFSYMFTFDNLDEYQDVRKGLITDYGVDSKSEIFTFYPAISSDKSNRYDYQPVENGNYKVSYESFVSYVVNISDGEYSYLNDITVKSGEKEYHVFVLCVINDDEEIVSVKGYAPSKSEVQESVSSEEQTSDGQEKSEEPVVEDSSEENNSTQTEVSENE